MNERLLEEIRDEICKSNLILNKMLARIEEYVEYRKKQEK